MYYSNFMEVFCSIYNWSYDFSSVVFAVVFDVFQICKEIIAFQKLTYYVYILIVRIGAIIVHYIWMIYILK